MDAPGGRAGTSTSHGQQPMNGAVDGSGSTNETEALQLGRRRRAICSRCKRPEGDACLCPSLPPQRIRTDTHVVVLQVRSRARACARVLLEILCFSCSFGFFKLNIPRKTCWLQTEQHPHEQRQKLATVPLLPLCLDEQCCTVIVGRRFSAKSHPHLAELLEQCSCEKQQQQQQQHQQHQQHQQKEQQQQQHQQQPCPRGVEKILPRPTQVYGSTLPLVAAGAQLQPTPCPTSEATAEAFKQTAATAPRTGNGNAGLSHFSSSGPGEHKVDAEEVLRVAGFESELPRRQPSARAPDCQSAELISTTHSFPPRTDRHGVCAACGHVRMLLFPAKEAVELAMWLPSFQLASLQQPCRPVPRSPLMSTACDLHQSLSPTLRVHVDNDGCVSAARAGAEPSSCFHPTPSHPLAPIKGAASPNPFARVTSLVIPHVAMPLAMQNAAHDSTSAIPLNAVADDAVAASSDPGGNQHGDKRQRKCGRRDSDDAQFRTCTDTCQHLASTQAQTHHEECVTAGEGWAPTVANASLVDCPAVTAICAVQHEPSPFGMSASCEMTHGDSKVSIDAVGILRSGGLPDMPIPDLEGVAREVTRVTSDPSAAVGPASSPPGIAAVEERGMRVTGCAAEMEEEGSCDGEGQPRGGTGEKGGCGRFPSTRRAVFGSRRRTATLVVFDGTWQHAREMARWSRPFLDQHCALVCLPFKHGEDGPSPSRDALIMKKEPQAGFVSTAEAVARALNVLEATSNAHDAIVRALQHMVDVQMARMEAAAVRRSCGGRDGGGGCHSSSSVSDGIDDAKGAL